jgi:hypothetical protein
MSAANIATTISMKSGAKAIGARAVRRARMKGEAKTRPLPKPKLVMEFEDWPEADRRLWTAGEWINAKPRHPGLGSRLRPVTIRNAMRAYGRFLMVLEEAGELLPGESPAQRVTPERVATYLAALKAQDNRDNSIKVRLFDLRVAIRIMEPKAKLDWLTRPGGHSLDSLLKQEPREFPIIPSPVLYAWGIGLMEDEMGERAPGEGEAGQAAGEGTGRSRNNPAAVTIGNEPAGGMRTRNASAGRVAARYDWSEETLQIQRDRSFRDGLIIAILACRAPRLRSLADMRLDRHLRLVGEEFWLCFGKGDVKNRKPIEYSLPEGLTPYIHRYLDEVRPRLLQDLRSEWVWVIDEGGRFQDIGIGQMIRRRSLASFGHAFGPHRFRHALATTLAEEDPENPGLAAGLLGVTEQVVAGHYRRAKTTRTALRLQKQLAEERERTRLLAEREAGPPKPQGQRRQKKEGTER